MVAMILAFVLLFAVCAMAAEGTEDPAEKTEESAAGAGESGGDAGAPEDNAGESADDTGESGENDGESGGDDGESADVGGLNLTEETFEVGDVPEEYLEPADEEYQGTIERVRYKITGEDGEQETKTVMVYLPAGYEDNDEPYNILYMLHASGGSQKDYLDKNNVTEFQCLLDHMIANGEMEPMIVAAPTYFSSDPFMTLMPLTIQVEEISDFPDEMMEYIIPAVESEFRTYAETTDEAGIVASRDHRGVAGFSLGGTATWNMFIQKMSASRWFLPISEASWDDGEGGISGIWDSDLSAEVLYEAVKEQGYGPEDFILFVATGTEDTAFEIATEQMKSLLEYSDMFMTSENTSCSMMIGGAHTKSAIYTYMYHIFPDLFY